MKKQIAFVAGTALCVGAASAQINPNLGAASGIVHTAKASEAGGVGNVRNPIVASLTYDGVQTYGFAGQDFEAIFDAYDTYVLERFGTTADANLTEFRSTAFGTGNPFAVTDVVAEIYPASAEGDICDDANVPAPLLTSTGGAGFYDGVDGVTDFGGQCLPAGDYILRWGGVLNFTTFGQIFWFGQSGAHDTGLGTADDGFQNNPGNAFGLGICFGTDVAGTPVGVNFVLCGDAATCNGGGCFFDTGCPADVDGDGDADSDDFFGYLDLFANGDVCADLDGDQDADSDDFFGYLDLFATGC